MADSVIIQGKSYPWLGDDQGNAYVRIRSSDVSLGVPASYDLQSKQVSDTVSYYGEAVPGTATSVAGWRVKKVTIDAAGAPTVEWETSAAFDKVWDIYEAL